MKTRIVGYSVLLLVAVSTSIIPSVRGNPYTATFTIPAYILGQSIDVTSQALPVSVKSGQVISGTIQSNQPVWVMIVTAATYAEAASDGTNGFADIQSNDRVGLHYEGMMIPDVDLMPLGPVTQFSLYWTCVYGSGNIM